MPILDVEVVLKPGESLGREVAAELANRAAQIFGAPPRSTWVKLRTIASDHYAENGGDWSPEVYPVFVTILKARLPAPEQIRAEVAALTPVIAQVCARPAENVHVIYAPEGAGRVAFGGELVVR
jgi:phenylpyruvate tautomerase PptA (4-oxalocrotonate tautomerase family)